MGLLNGLLLWVQTFDVKKDQWNEPVFTSKYTPIHIQIDNMNAAFETNDEKMIMEKSFHSHFHRAEDKDTIARCASKLQHGRIVVFPTSSTYVMGANAMNPESVAALREIAKLSPGVDLVMYVLSWEMARLFIDSQVSLSSLRTCGQVTYQFPKNELSHSIDMGNSTYLSIVVSNQPVVQELLRLSMIPILTTIPYQRGSFTVPCTVSEHLQKYYTYHGIDILLQEEPTGCCIENTVVRYPLHQSPFVLHRGWVSFPDLPIHTNTVLSSPVSGLKRCVLFRVVDLPDALPILPKDSETLFENYLRMSIVLDFGGRNKAFRAKAQGYVDLSSTSRIEEALFNLSNVFYQVDTYDELTNVLIFDFYSTRNEPLYQTMSGELHRMTHGRQLLIPRHFLMNSEEEGEIEFEEDTIEDEEEIEEEGEEEMEEIKEEEEEEEEYDANE